MKPQGLLVIFLILLIAGAILVSARTPSQNKFPLKSGHAWIYESVTPIGKNVRKLTVSGRVPVGSSEGYELTSQAGSTRLVWRGSWLHAGMLSGTAYQPPLPLLSGDQEAVDWKWDGEIVSPLGRVHASSTSSQSKDDRIIAGHKVKCEKVVQTISTGKSSTELTTWYASDIGIIGQEERQSDVLINKLNYVSGP